MTLLADTTTIPDIAAITEQNNRLRAWVRQTPTLETDEFQPIPGTKINFKFELLQVGGTFKTRGAFSNLLAMDAAQRAAGVTCVSAGNHAVAVAYAAMRLNISAKVVMLKTASAARVELCHRYGAQVELAENGALAFEAVRRIQEEEGRFFVHPFNGYHTVLGTATLGQEWMAQAGALDAVIIPVGGGGLMAGMSTAIRLAAPQCDIYGVEPEGADVMHQSFANEGPVKMGAMATIADSLMAPHTEQYSYALCRRHITDLVRVSDHELRQAMRLLFDQLKLATEPACAAATAALLGPLHDKLAGKRVGVLLCGTNTDPQTFARHLAQAAA
ncbi:threonine/serine dehydratase [Bordetella pseudohinzii]|uniref:Phenylserine dehydratase n=1 Tax=Bordetella pseudohinzii TaxID=1331258 RepID=A0A0J6EY87_9BORD|nr:threonine/serine dehydratase [Bordetella pseudohinzii]ANY16203.1 serine/threonine dehydratase [Bordetella pseudohinzii]KMM25305.1 pyridoxal-5'-phosphate-dependent protein subunit beta [Bordetella pseudohinzii]KXA78664.1 pyridoxal-5'-phosphate-dependent protein subunit beta [Bordetella pseudohinzii]KXA81197.1 pyridoxal-5'-phosphate-dependent protein subunit beta [Bordetella pseudohinzii]CUJ05129.1 Phenylserine dehydratase [Bordetella pseudohinzii]